MSRKHMSVLKEMKTGALEKVYNRCVAPELEIVDEMK